MTEQDKKYVIEALEYALHKCIDVDGNSETHYNTLANAIEVVKHCSIPDVVGQSEQLKAFCLHGGIQMLVPTKAKDLDELIKDYVESL